MQNISDREYIGWSGQVLEQWEEGIYVFPMWYRCVHLPQYMWQIYRAMSVLRETREEPTSN